MNLFELFVKIGVDDQATDKIKKVGDTAEKTAKGGLSNFAGKLGSGIATAAKIGTAAVGAAATGITALTTAAVNNYAEYEQLVGGAQLMFGNAYDTVAKNAQDAYKTVQMSQSEYLQQVNGFATGLKTALGGNEQAAAELAHNIVQAEADIIAATGNTAENVQNAFNGIMKSNFTMLDNLQIGITPTKEGFQEVIDKVNDWNKANGEATNYQMGNLADMQSALVDYIDMVGMSGYAQREASETITGSLSSMKAAWTNLVTGFADDGADLDKLIGNLTDSVVGYTDENGKQVKGVLDNLLPAIEKSLGGIASLIEGAVPKVIEILPGLIEGVVPSLITSATNIVNSFVSVIPSLLKTVVGELVKNAPALIDAAISMIEALLDGLYSNFGLISSAFSELLKKVAGLISGEANYFVQGFLDILLSLGDVILENAPLLIDAITEVIDAVVGWFGEYSEVFAESAILILQAIVTGILQNLPTLAQTAFTTIQYLANTIITNLPQIIALGLQLITSLASGIASSIPTLLPTLIDLVLQVVKMISDPENLSQLLNAAMEIIKALAEYLIDPEVINQLLDTMIDVVHNIVNFIAENLDPLLEAATEIILALVDYLLDPENAKKLADVGWDIVVSIAGAIVASIYRIAMAANDMIKKIKEKFKDANWKEIGKNIIQGMKNGLSSAWYNLKDWFSGLFDDIIGIAKSILGIASPSKVFKKIGGFTAEGFGVGFDDEFANVKEDVENSLDFGDASFGINASVRKVGTGAAELAYGGTSIGNITINIDGAKYSDEQSLAEAIAFEIQNMTNRRSAVYA